MSDQEDAPRWEDYGSKAPKALEDFFDDIADYMESQRPVAGTNVFVSDAAGGGRLIDANGGGGLTGGGSKPFEVIIQNNGSNGTDKWQAIVSGNSVLLDGVPDNDFTALNPETIDISGIASDDPPAKSDPAWRNVTTTDVIWLELAWDTSSDPYTVATAAIKSLGHGDTFGGGGVENDGGMTDGDGNTIYTQTKSRNVLVTTTSIKAGVPIIDNRLHEGGLVTADGGYADSNDSSGGSEQKIKASYAVPY